MGQVRSAVLPQLQVAQRTCRGCGCCPEPSALDLTAQHRPGLWVIMWITPDKRLHGLWGPKKGHSFWHRVSPASSVLSWVLSRVRGCPDSVLLSLGGATAQLPCQWVPWQSCENADADSAGLGQACSVCISNTLPRDAEAAGTRTTRSKSVDTWSLGFEEGSPSRPGEVRGGMLGDLSGVRRVAGGK